MRRRPVNGRFLSAQAGRRTGFQPGRRGSYEVALPPYHATTLSGPAARQIRITKSGPRRCAPTGGRPGRLIVAPGGARCAAARRPRRWGCPHWRRAGPSAHSHHDLLRHIDLAFALLRLRHQPDLLEVRRHHRHHNRVDELPRRKRPGHVHRRDQRLHPHLGPIHIDHRPRRRAPARSSSPLSPCSACTPWPLVQRSVAAYSRCVDLPANIDESTHASRTSESGSQALDPTGHPALVEPLGTAQHTASRSESIGVQQEPPFGLGATPAAPHPAAP